MTFKAKNCLKDAYGSPCSRILLMCWSRPQAEHRRGKNWGSKSEIGEELEEGKRPPPPRQDSASGLY